MIRNRAVNNLYVQMVLLCLESWTSQWHHPVRGVGHQEPDWFSLTSWTSYHYISTSVIYSVFKWEKRSRDYFLPRVKPTITKIKKKQFQFNGGLNLWPCPWELDLGIDWHTNNLSHHGWALNYDFIYFLFTHPFSHYLPFILPVSFESIKAGQISLFPFNSTTNHHRSFQKQIKIDY